MGPLLCSEDVIDAMIDVIFGANVAERDKEICREALRGLVRLGQAEQLYTMQMDFNQLTTGPIAGGYPFESIR